MQLFSFLCASVGNPPDRVEDDQARKDHPPSHIFGLDHNKPADRKKHQSNNNARNEWANFDFRHDLSFRGTQ